MRNSEQIRKVEEEVKQVWEYEISELKKSETEDNILDKYYVPIEYIKSVARGYNKSFIFLGKAGIGKSYITKQTLAKEGVKFIESRGVTSPLALYNFLYNNNSSDIVLVFDDVANLINNENSYSILLGILWENIACWNSTTEKLKIPKQFIFKGRIIIIANKLKGNNAEIIKSRCLVYNLKMTREDKINMMYKIAKQEHKELSVENRFKIVDFIKTNTNNATFNLDLRTQVKAENLYNYSPESWGKLVLAMFEKKREVEILEFALETSNSIKEAQNLFTEQTGLSRATFHRIKSGLETKSLKKV